MYDAHARAKGEEPLRRRGALRGAVIIAFLYVASMAVAVAVR